MVRICPNTDGAVAISSLAHLCLALGAAVGPEFLVPYVYDVDLTMEYNNDLFSGIADTYLGVRAVANRVSPQDGFCCGLVSEPSAVQHRVG